ncbi:hypothetical protein OMCYN_01391 [cyanobiont of Ornithocercus magnificus]|nr:hypothetical protein OMCYN_01391 [cyanobiont of Ornithocercus magnificus]
MCLTRALVAHILLLLFLPSFSFPENMVLKSLKFAASHYSPKLTSKAYWEPLGTEVACFAMQCNKSCCALLWLQLIASIHRQAYALGIQPV